VFAPLTLSVAEFPLQITVGDADAVIVGFGFTTICMVPVPVQLPLVPVTVKIEVIAGDTVNVFPVEDPGFHV
jgi:hypothetical protein